MDVKQLAALLHQYHRFQTMIDPFRYSCTVPAIEISDGIFGMNFEKLFSLPLEEQANWFLAQQQPAYSWRNNFG